MRGLAGQGGARRGGAGLAGVGWGGVRWGEAQLHTIIDGPTTLTSIARAAEGLGVRPSGPKIMTAGYKICESGQ